MPNSPLRLGVIGCGAIARFIFKECEGLESIRLAACCDPNPENLQRFSEETGCPSVRNLEELLESPDVDAVVLTAPPSIRSQQAILAVQFGKSVFSEKPLALSAEEAGVVVDAARRAKQHLMVGQVLRYFGGFGILADQARSGELGTPVALTAQRFGPPFSEPAREKWRLAKNTSGGLLFEVHVHELDYSRYLLGNPTNVFARSRRVGADPDSDYEDLYLAQIDFDSGAIGQYHFSQSSPSSKNTITLFTDKGTAWAGFGEAGMHLWGQQPVNLFPSDPAALEPPYRKEIRLFAESVLEDKPVPISGEDGLWAVAMAEACERSARSGIPVSVQEVLGR